MTSIKISNLDVSFLRNDSLIEVLRGVSFEVAPGEIVAIRGPNGAGKTTLLNIVAGLLEPSAGEISFSPSQFNGLSIPVAFVQQDYTSSLLPWFNAIDNIAIPLRLKGTRVDLRRQMAKEIVRELGFQELPLDSYPHQLSGGQKQRIAIARALISEPRVLILDEPFANLDSNTCRELEELLHRIHSTTGMTILFVSHDLDSSIYLSDKIVLLHGQPASVSRILPVPLARPRNRDDFFSNGFNTVRELVIKEEEGQHEVKA